MSKPQDDWDADERDAVDGLAAELAELRRRHQDDPSLAMLRAAEADALPPDLQAEVTRHLKDSAWSRALVEGLRDVHPDDHLDAASEDRLFDRITREARAEAAGSSRRWWKPAMAVGGLALAATVLIAVLLPRSRPATSVTPAVAEPPAAPAAAAPTPQPLLIAFNKPDIKLGLAALTWRGDAGENPFLKDLAPAFDAYRANDYPRAIAEFDRLSVRYPDAIEVRFYQAVSRMLAGDDAGAIAPLEAADRLRSETFGDDVAWFLAVAQQRSGKADVRATFAKLCGGSGAHAAAACAAVSSLDAATLTPRPQ